MPSRRLALEFGRLVEIERAKGNKGEAAMEIVRRRAPKLWGGRTKAYELWAEYQTHKEAQAEYERQYAQMQAEEGRRTQS